ncbi:hypothetical protein ACF1A9_28685 [Streptomyces sp. NPDC014872]|uniref:hypothetical protein n=1 Tax=Streptomyces sp. NPDC014872 TaxID=3364926 RepID=UPI0037021852
MGLSLRAGRSTGPLPRDPWPQWSYGGFRLFRRGLAAHAGIDLPRMQGFGGDTAWTGVSSPLRHLLNHPDDSGEISADQARELAPVLHDALTALAAEDADGLLWGPDSHNGRAGRDLVALLTLCGAEGLPVIFV